MGSTNFYFQANEASASDVATAISDHYGVSVLLQKGDSGTQITGRVVADSLENSLDVLSFYLGTGYRSDDSGRIWMFGGDEVESIKSFPSYGLSAQELARFSGGQASAIGDRIVIQGDERVHSEISEVLKVVSARKTVGLELLVIDVSARDFERLNAWLDSLGVTVGYAAQKTLAVNPAMGGVLGSTLGAFQASGITYDVSINSVLGLLDDLQSTKMELRQQLQIVSGTTVVFSSGQIIEQQLFVRPDESETNLITQIERRTVGLDVNLTATNYDEKWHFVINISDSSLNETGETTTVLETEKIVDANQSNVWQLASFSRKVKSRVVSTSPLLKVVPFLKRKTKRDNTQTDDRQVVVLGRLL